MGCANGGVDLEMPNGKFMNRKNLGHPGWRVSFAISCCHFRLGPRRARRCVKVIDAYDQEQILISPEDGIFGNTDFFQFG